MKRIYPSIHAFMDNDEQYHRGQIIAKKVEKETKYTYKEVEMMIWCITYGFC